MGNGLIVCVLKFMLIINFFISRNPIEDERPTKERKKHDRFNGMPQEEVSKRTIPDHLTHSLDIVIVSL
jgi:hypothetical protein